MSREDLAQVTGRTVIDTRFRALFFGDVDRALEGYDLTGHETNVLRAMSNCSVIRTGISIAGYRYRQIEARLGEEE
jgi:hypothetical protein